MTAAKSTGDARSGVARRIGSRWSDGWAWLLGVLCAAPARTWDRIRTRRERVAFRTAGRTPAVGDLGTATYRPARPGKHEIRGVLRSGAGAVRAEATLRVRALGHDDSEQLARTLGLDWSEEAGTHARLALNGRRRLAFRVPIVLRNDISELSLTFAAAGPDARHLGARPWLVVSESPRTAVIRPEDLPSGGRPADTRRLLVRRFPDRLERADAAERLGSSPRLSREMREELLRYAFALDETVTRGMRVAEHAFREHFIRLPGEICRRLVDREQHAGRLGARHERALRILGYAELFDYLPILPQPPDTPAYVPAPRTALMCLHQCRPHHSNGYAVRSHGLLRAMLESGWTVHPVARPGYPWDDGVELEGDECRVDGVDYRFLPGPDLRRQGLARYVEESAREIEAHARRVRPAVMHAASAYVSAIPTLLAARRLGIPFVYEVRGLWEVTQASIDSHFDGSERYLLQRRLEIFVARNADRVLTLTSAMREELVARGVDRGRIELAPNAVDVDAFAPREPDEALRARIGLVPGIPTIGYVGSFVAYEGLDDLVRACAAVHERDVRFQLLLVGDGKVHAEVRRLVDELGLGERTVMPGRVPPSEVAAYYSLIDIAPFPRKPIPVCEIVSPLKPFEALAMSKAVVVSDVGALSEIVPDGTGLRFAKGDVDALAEQLGELVRDPVLRARLGEAGRRAVAARHTWRHVQAAVREQYDELALGEVLPPPRDADRDIAVRVTGGVTYVVTGERCPWPGRTASVVPIEFERDDGRRVVRDQRVNVDPSGRTTVSISVPHRARIVFLPRGLGEIRMRERRRWRLVPLADRDAPIAVSGTLAAAATADLEPGTWHRLRGSMSPHEQAPENPLVAVFDFGRRADSTLARQTGLTTSDAGLYAYLPRAPGGTFDVRFRAPAGVDSVRIELRAWDVTEPVRLGATVRLEVERGARAHVLRRVDRLRVAAIMDTFSERCFAPSCDLVTFTPESWRDALESEPPHLLLVESAWHGVDNTWHRRVGYYSDESFAALVALTEWCRERGIPTVFWNKEDPVHFNRFARTARLFDHVFTTDELCTPAYRAQAGPHSKTVASLPFAAQPVLHNPVLPPGRSRGEDICYAGTYYGERYPARRRELDAMLDAAAEFPLVIFDRQTMVPDSPYAFPARFGRFVRDGVPYEEMVEEYRAHRLFLNANSVADSPTMFSRRVFELAACGTPVVSGAGAGIEEIFRGSVPVVRDPARFPEAIGRLMRRPDEWRSARDAAMRVVWRDHLYGHRLAEIARTAGLRCDAPGLPEYAVFVAAADDRLLLRLVADLTQQSHRPSQILACTSGSRESTDTARAIAAAHGMRLLPLAGPASDDELARALEVPWFVRYSPDACYGHLHFEDLLHCTKFCDSPAIGPAAPCVSASRAEAQEFTPATPLIEEAAVIHRSMLDDGGAASGGGALHGFAASAGQFAPLRGSGRLTVLVAGHDLKFIAPLVEGFEARGHRVLQDEWQSHRAHDPARSEELLAQADVIACEWCLGNAVWYSQHKRPGQNLLVRFHRQEIVTDFPAAMRFDQVDAMIFVSDHMRRQALAKFGWPEHKCRVVPNAVDGTELDVAKDADARFNLGLVGFVPRMKRLDLALDILAAVRAVDPRFRLHVKGKTAREYPWMSKRPGELEYYDAQTARIGACELLTGAVDFDGFGDDMPQWYANIGTVLSLSDFESFHLTVADGAASRAVPAILSRVGADELYSAEWIHDSVEEAARSILTSVDEATWRDRGARARAYATARFDLELVADVWDGLLRPLSAAMLDVAPLPSPLHGIHWREAQ